MMPPLFQRFIGLVLIIGATAGLIFNIAGLFLMPRLAEGVRQQTLGTLSRLNETLITIEEGLVVVDNSLDNAGNTLDAVEITIRGVAEGIEETAPLLSTMSALTGQDLPEIIANTQDSLAVAEQGAQGIEIVLGSFNSIFPLINTYNPDVPLYQSLSNISESLSPLVDSFVEIEKSLNIASDNLQQVSDDTITVADNLAEIDQNITDAKDVIDQF
jgi:methyl-accepting chemotaxis protein